MSRFASVSADLCREALLTFKTAVQAGWQVCWLQLLFPGITSSGHQGLALMLRRKSSALVHGKCWNRAILLIAGLCCLVKLAQAEGELGAAAAADSGLRGRHAVNLPRARIQARLRPRP